MIQDMAIKNSILAFLIIALTFSCNPIRKAERLILNNKNASERIFRALEPLYPCANDTTIMTKYDTTLLIDTIINYKRDTIYINGIKYITIKEEPKTIIKTVKVNQIKTGYVVDTRSLGIALDSVRYYKTLAQVNKDTSKAWSRRFWVLLISLIIAAFLKYRL
jgi:hypothetical protein